MKSGLHRWVMMAVLPVLMSALPVAAQEQGNCFMVNSSGRTVNLGSLCGTTPNTSVFRVPIKRRLARIPVIDVTFNGNQTFEMILDTGASGTLITQGMANALRVQPSGAVQLEIADGSQVQMLSGKVQSITVGGAYVGNVEVAIAPRMRIGLLGHDFFSDYDVKILKDVVEFHRR